MYGKGNKSNSLKIQNNTSAKTVSDKYKDKWGGEKMDADSSQGTGPFMKKGPMENA